MLNIVEIPQAGGWFKPAEHRDAKALLIEVQSFQYDRPTPNGPKNSALCDITVFDKGGNPTSLKGIRVEQKALANSLESLVGNATIVTIDQAPPSKPGQHAAWVWRPVKDSSIRQHVIDYATKREAAAEAAMDDAPDFD